MLVLVQGWFGQKVGAVFGRKWVLFWAENKGSLGKYRNSFGGHLQSEKFGPRDAW